MKRLLLIPLSFLAVYIILSIPDHLRDRAFFQTCERMGIPFEGDWIWKLTH